MAALLFFLYSPLLKFCLYYCNIGHNNGYIKSVWNHGTKLSGQGFKCGYCRCTNKGGGATRLRDHLGCIVGEVKSCPSVPRDVRDAMRALRQEKMANKKEKEQRRLRLERDLMQGTLGDDGVIDLASDEEDQARMEIRKKWREGEGMATLFVFQLGMATLSYDKLHKLVYVHYNLKERIQEKGGQQQKEVDLCAMMLDAAQLDEANPIWDWLDKAMSDVGPSLDDLYPSMLDKSACGRSEKRARVEEEDEIEFLDSETGEEEEYEDAFSSDESARANSDDDGNSGEPAETSPLVEENREAPNGRRSSRLRKKKRVDTLY
ncbi:hypothetical protein HU200_016649 [Digitaria exilis]|uniref:BED-type domain-containing protein n=1 Tax=Digitaria exilis TaxID=1010633 RepID=A0A835F889_9POAL|nr:hypothetical protein HU200_016649 [Digitaria exilis]